MHEGRIVRLCFLHLLQAFQPFAVNSLVPAGVAMKLVFELFQFQWIFAPVLSFFILFEQDVL